MMRKTTIKKKCLSTLGALIICVNMNAYDILVDHIYYDVNLEDMTVSVTSGDISYMGNITIPASIVYNGHELQVVSVDGKSFKSCSDLKSVTISEGIKSIESAAFYNCRNLSKVVLPKTLKNLGSHVFWNCSSLESVDIPDGIKNITQTCFYGCTSLKSVKIPESVTSIESNAFTGCESLKQIELPKSLIEIVNWAFARTGLVSITIPSSVIFISCDAFQNCSSLKNVTFEDGEKDLFIGAGTANILLEASPLESLYIGRNYSFLLQDNSLISSNTLKRVTFGKNGTNYQNFTSTENLEEIYCNFINPTNVPINFSTKTYLNATLFVPKGTKEDFTKANCWKYFFNIQEFDVNSTAVKDIKQTNDRKLYYNLNGIWQPYPNKGVNIIQTSNGKLQKILIK